MQSIRLAAVFIALSCTLFSCSKGDDDGGSPCEDANTSTVKFSNTADRRLRVQVAYQLTPQYEPINPVVTLDLDPGQSVTKEIPAERYMVVWRNDCPDHCSLATNYARTYESCQAYTEEVN